MENEEWKILPREQKLKALHTPGTAPLPYMIGSACVGEWQGVKRRALHIYNTHHHTFFFAITDLLAVGA